ncbi:MAG TPA: acyltransferase family protein [Acidothermaceae bacterium]
MKTAGAIAVTRTTGRQLPAGRRHLPGLDGLRAIAVVGVLLYHAGVGWIPGGFLGVDLFFVISGFLITSLLLAESDLTGRISLRHFYLRRARRLLPALAAMLVVVVSFMAVFFRGDLGQARGDVAAAASYVSNWWYVLHHRSYFVAAGRPSPLQHLWSLAVEEQFYLVWPVVVVALVATRARLRWITVVAVAGALGSAFWMRTLAIRGNVPFDTDSSRVYFGTDTHASALLLGAAAAAFMTGLAGRRVVTLPAIARHLIDMAALAGLVALGWSMYAVGYYTPSLYRGGFLEFAAIAAVVVAIVSAPGGWLGRALDVAPMRWIGERSYGLYLWHWPVFVYTRPGLDWQLHGAVALGVRLAIVAVLTELSYRFVEVPLRRRGVVSTVRAVRPMPRSWRVVAPVLGAVLGVVGVVGATTFVSTRISQSSRASARHAAAAPGRTGGAEANGASGHGGTLGPVSAVGAGSTARSGGAPVGALRPVASAAGSSPAVGRSTSASAGELAQSLPSSPSPASRTQVAMPPTGAPTHPATAPTTARGYPTAPPPIPTGAPPALSAVGDSVMLDAASTLKLVCPGTEVYAVVGWQAKAVFGELDTLRAAGHLGAVVVIETGTNGIVSPKELDAELTALADRAQVIVINDHMARPWEPSNNAMFPVVVKAHPNAVLVNWDDAANAHPDWLSKDGVHLKPAGRGPYAQLIKTAAGC